MRLKDAKITFLKRNTTEVQVYIRKILLESLKSRVNQYDSRFLQEYSRRLIAEKFDLYATE